MREGLLLLALTGLPLFVCLSLFSQHGSSQPIRFAAGFLPLRAGSMHLRSGVGGQIHTVAVHATTCETHAHACPSSMRASFPSPSIPPPFSSLYSLPLYTRCSADAATLRPLSLALPPPLSPSAFFYGSSPAFPWPAALGLLQVSSPPTFLRSMTRCLLNRISARDACCSSAPSRDRTSSACETRPNLRIRSRVSFLSIAVLCCPRTVCCCGVRSIFRAAWRRSFLDLTVAIAERTRLPKVSNHAMRVPESVESARAPSLFPV